MAGRGIPRRRGRLKRFFTQPTPYDIGLALVAVFPAAAAAWKFFDDNKPVLGGLCVAGSAAGLLIALAKNFVLWWAKPEEQPPHDLAGSLHALQAVLLSDKPSSDPRLRLTIHVPMHGGSQLEQVLDYVGDRRGGKTAGRTFSIHCGIIGKVFREKKWCVTRRKNDDYESYVRELIQDWGYTNADARELDQSTMAWMAVPLLNHLDSDKVEGVVYLDATDRDFFTDVRRDLVLCACAGIANYVAHRYN